MRHYRLGWQGWWLQLWRWWWGWSTTWCCRGRSHLERGECKRLARGCCGTDPPSRSCHNNSSNPSERQEIENVGENPKHMYRLVNLKKVSGIHTLPASVIVKYLIRPEAKNIILVDISKSHPPAYLSCRLCPTCGNRSNDHRTTFAWKSGSAAE